MSIIIASCVIGWAWRLRPLGEPMFGKSLLGMRVRVRYVETMRQKSQGVSSWLGRMCM